MREGRWTPSVRTEREAARGTAQGWSGWAALAGGLSAPRAARVGGRVPGVGRIVNVSFGFGEGPGFVVYVATPCLASSLVLPVWHSALRWRAWRDRWRLAR